MLPPKFQLDFDLTEGFNFRGMVSSNYEVLQSMLHWGVRASYIADRLSRLIEKPITAQRLLSELRAVGMEKGDLDKQLKSEALMAFLPEGFAINQQDLIHSNGKPVLNAQEINQVRKQTIVCFVESHFEELESLIKGGVGYEALAKAIHENHGLDYKPTTIRNAMTKVRKFNS